MGSRNAANSGSSTHTPTPACAAAGSASPRGSGRLFDYNAQRFPPEAFLIEVDRRSAWWIIDLPDQAAIVECTHLGVGRAGAEPTLRSIVLGADVENVLPKALADARRAP